MALLSLSVLQKITDWDHSWLRPQKFTQNTYSGMSSYPVWGAFLQGGRRGRGKKGRQRERETVVANRRQLGQRSLTTPISLLYQHNLKKAGHWQSLFGINFQFLFPFYCYRLALSHIYRPATYQLRKYKTWFPEKNSHYRRMLEARTWELSTVPRSGGDKERRQTQGAWRFRDIMRAKRKTECREWKQEK